MCGHGSWQERGARAACGTVLCRIHVRINRQHKPQTHEKQAKTHNSMTSSIIRWSAFVLLFCTAVEWLRLPTEVYLKMVPILHWLEMCDYLGNCLLVLPK